MSGVCRQSVRSSRKNRDLPGLPASRRRPQDNFRWTGQGEKPVEPELAELFARAEFKRGTCAASAASMDWVSGAENPGSAQSDRVRLPRRWFSCNFFSRLVIIVMQCGPIDLVAVYPRQLN
jgi:hypothetical protein